ncbi:MAG: hypothetical protein B7Z37_25005 [Verrucomicrobia bacterium 12-59-8]|nr:MAG: hypothetical protein B7Z37_25005 [Verrucomicrobia bacterium 12-59-8]
MTVANNLGFECRSSTFDHDWVSNRQVKFYSIDRKPLLAVRAFKNRNIHLHFDSQLMLAINVEAGRLLGWLHSHEQAVEELQADKEEAEVIRQVFNSSFRIGQGNTLLRLT